MLSRQELTLVASSNPASGAINISPDGDAFEIVLQDGLQIPKNARSITVQAQESAIWNVTPNIITGTNDTFYIDGPDVANVLTSYTIVISQGQYDLPGLREALLRGLEAAGAKISPDPLLTLSPNPNTQKVLVTFNYSNVEIDFTQADTPRDILGFDSAVYGPYASVPTTIEAPNVAGFNTVNSFLILTDLVSQGIRYGNRYSSIILQTPITAAPGSLINYQPYNPPAVPEPSLAGTSRTSIRFYLRDDSLRAVNTNGEYWSVRLRISWEVPFVLT